MTTVAIYRCRLCRSMFERHWPDVPLALATEYRGSTETHRCDKNSPGFGVAELVEVTDRELKEIRYATPNT